MARTEANNRYLTSSHRTQRPETQVTTRNMSTHSSRKIRRRLTQSPMRRSPLSPRPRTYPPRGNFPHIRSRRRSCCCLLATASNPRKNRFQDHLVTTPPQALTPGDFLAIARSSKALGACPSDPRKNRFQDRLVTTPKILGACPSAPRKNRFQDRLVTTPPKALGTCPSAPRKNRFQDRLVTTLPKTLGACPSDPRKNRFQDRLVTTPPKALIPGDFFSIARSSKALGACPSDQEVCRRTVDILASSRSVPTLDSLPSRCDLANRSQWPEGPSDPSSRDISSASSCS